MSPAKNVVAEVRPSVDFFYLFSLLWIALIGLRVPLVPYRWGAVQQSFFISTLVMALSTFPVSWWLAQKFLGAAALSEPAFAVQRLRTGSLVMAAMGEACAVYGYAYYCVSGDLKRPWVFIALTPLHYRFTRTRLDAAVQTLERAGVPDAV